MKRFLLLLSSFCFAYHHHYVEQWTTYRLTEIFEDSVQNETLQPFFSEIAWSSFEKAVSDSNLGSLWQEHYHSKIIKFIKPVQIIAGEDHQYYAQATFLVQFSNPQEKWLQPFEMFLVIEEDENLKIKHFEGQTKNIEN